MDINSIKSAILWYTFLAVPVVGVMAFVIFQPITVLPRIALSPGYTLINEQGNRITSEDQRGRLTLYNFSYTSCELPCTQMNQIMYQVQQEIIPQLAVDASYVDASSAGTHIDLLTVSVDPNRDTPDVLQQHAAALKANKEHWHFASGDPRQLKEMIGGNFNTFYSQQEDGGFELDPAFILVDGWGIQRAEYRLSQPDLTLLKRDINLLLREAQNSKGITKYAYEAAHLFLCYP